MDKKVNTILFVLGATLFNILISILSFAVLAFIYIKFIMAVVPEESRAWIFAIIFIAALVISFLLYRLVLKLIMKKIDINEHFDSIFGRRNIKKN